MDGQTARQSTLLATGARLFDQSRGLQTIQGRSLDSLQRTPLCHDPVHGLEHLIDPDYVVKDAALDQLQRCWLYKIQDIMRAPAKAIVVRHLKDKDTRTLWKEILAHYDNSMTQHSSEDLELSLFRPSPQH
jgi:hypothetical protein